VPYDVTDQLGQIQLSVEGLAPAQVLAEKCGKGIVGSAQTRDWNFPTFFVPGRNIRTVAHLITRLEALPPDTSVADAFADAFLSELSPATLFRSDRAW
jgi:hypothetical protein